MNTEGFENLTLNTFDKENTLLNNSYDLESNFFNTNTTYFTPQTLKTLIKKNNEISYSVLQYQKFK